MAKKVFFQIEQYSVQNKLADNVFVMTSKTRALTIRHSIVSGGGLHIAPVSISAIYAESINVYCHLLLPSQFFFQQNVYFPSYFFPAKMYISLVLSLLQKCILP